MTSQKQKSETTIDKRVLRRVCVEIISDSLLINRQHQAANNLVYAARPKDVDRQDYVVCSHYVFGPSHAMMLLGVHSEENLQDEALAGQLMGIYYKKYDDSPEEPVSKLAEEILTAWVSFLEQADTDNISGKSKDTIHV